MDTAISKNNFIIRLNAERWFHITEGHSELSGYYFEVLETIENPDIIYEGNQEELLAVRRIEKEKFLVVIYKELDPNDGFVITAFLTKKINYLKNRKVLWNKGQ